MRTKHAIALLFLAIGLACGRGPTAREDTPADASSRTPALSAWPLQVEPLALPATGASAEPQLTSSARGVILSWLEHVGAAATLKFAERTPAGWSEAREVASASDWFISWADVPSVLRLSNGTLVATWYPATNPQEEAYDLRLSYSRDDGRTWAPALAPHHDATTTQHGFASLFELPGQRLGLVWLDGRNQAAADRRTGDGGMSLYFGSFDERFKQTAESLVDGRVCECCQTAAALTSDGLLAAFRDRSPREIRDVNVTRLENGAWTPARPLHVDNWEIDACPVNGPALSARDRTVAAAWFTAVGDAPRAFVSFSQDAGRTWGEPIRLDEASTLGHVDIELLDDGSAAATWMEFNEERSRLKVRRVEPSGARSAAMDVTSARVSGYPRLARQGDELVFAWAEAAGPGESGEQTKGAVARIPRLTAP